MLAAAVTVVLVVSSVRQAKEGDWGLSVTLAVGALAVALGAVACFIWFYRRRGRRERRSWTSERG